MARIICIDFGLKRCGLAVTDPLQIIVSALDTVDNSQLMAFLEKYFTQEKVEKMVIGMPVHKDGNATHLKPHIDTFVEKFKKKWPDIETDFADEQFSSAEARDIIWQMGVTQKKRRDKSLTDKISAVIILQRYLKHI